MSHDIAVFRALGGAAEAAERRGQDPAPVHHQIEKLAAQNTGSPGDCNTSVCGGFIAFGSPTGDVPGLGYCSPCERSTQSPVEWVPSAASTQPVHGRGAS